MITQVTTQKNKIFIFIISGISWVLEHLLIWAVLIQETLCIYRVKLGFYISGGDIWHAHKVKKMQVKEMENFLSYWNIKH
jgi:hypothetical protein